MFGKPSLMTRIAVGKGVGFLIGLAGFWSLPYFVADADWLIRWGILLWYTTVGAIIGFLIGLAGFLSLPYFVADADWLIRWGILLWYTTVGAIIGLFGVFDWHPVLKIPMPWWFRAPFMGAWMNFVLTFFAYDAMKAMMLSMFGPDGILSSPFWFTAEGAVVGLVIGFVATRVGGEGPETAGK